MKTNLIKHQNFTSFEEFLKTFYPKLKKTEIKEKDPRDAGKRVARTSLAKHEHFFHKKKRTRLA